MSKHKKMNQWQHFITEVLDIGRDSENRIGCSVNVKAIIIIMRAVVRIFKCKNKETEPSNTNNACYYSR